MSRFIEFILLATFFLFSACSSVKVYKLKDQPFIHSAKSCGLNFCSEILVNEKEGRILVTDVYGFKASPALVEVNAVCNSLKKEPHRARHLKRVLKTNDSIELVPNAGFWEFEPASLALGCRLVISVASKRLHEKFQYTVMPKAVI